MGANNILFSIFLIFSTAAIVATLVLYTRQSLLVAYMLLGAIMGPFGFGFVDNAEMVRQIGDVGILFLLFLLGLDLNPEDLASMFRNVTKVAVLSSVVFAVIGYMVGVSFGFSHAESLIIGAAMMFSSTIIGLKLLPTTILHHQHTGEVMISILLMQDLLAIVVLLFLHGLSDSHGMNWGQLGLTIISLPALLGFGLFFNRYILNKIFIRFDTIKEYIFLVAIGWCLGMAQLAHLFGLPEEIGAFLAGISIAVGPIALYIAQSLKPLRDFFLVMFFFAVGASFDLRFLHVVWLPALILGTLMMVLKPWLFSVLLQRVGEGKSVAWEVGVRLAQASEFSLLVAMMALKTAPDLMGESAIYLIQAVTIFTFIVSSYWVVLRYPTPLALSERMRKD